jgi:glutamine phosphoribosylpyrophosphate amidotransferase
MPPWKTFCWVLRESVANAIEVETEIGMARISNISRSLTDEQYAALRIMAASLRGQSLATIMARGFSFELLQGLVCDGFATARRDTIGAGRTKAAHLRITDAGRKAIVG